jgi:hypothetical protein
MGPKLNGSKSLTPGTEQFSPFGAQILGMLHHNKYFRCSHEFGRGVRRAEAFQSRFAGHK